MQSWLNAFNLDLIQEGLFFLPLLLEILSCFPGLGHCRALLEWCKVTCLAKGQQGKQVNIVKSSALFSEAAGRFKCYSKVMLCGQRIGSMQMWLSMWLCLRVVALWHSYTIHTPPKPGSTVEEQAMEVSFGTLHLPSIDM